jgi:uncharacterized protein YndB with AHSA1/START domain
MVGRHRRAAGGSEPLSGVSNAGISVVERPSEREVVFSRAFAASRELLWKAWSDPRHLHRWFGPTGFTTTTHEFAFVPGGVWRFVMHAPDGTDVPNRIVFRELDPPARLVYENGWDLPGFPLDFTVVVTFVAEGDGTRLSIHMTFRDVEAMRTAVERYGVLEGGTQTLERIEAYVRSARR